MTDDERQLYEAYAEERRAGSVRRMSKDEIKAYEAYADELPDPEISGRSLDYQEQRVAAYIERERRKAEARVLLLGPFSVLSDEFLDKPKQWLESVMDREVLHVSQLLQLQESSARWFERELAKGVVESGPDTLRATFTGELYAFCETLQTGVWHGHQPGTKGGPQCGCDKCLARREAAKRGDLSS